MFQKNDSSLYKGAFDGQPQGLSLRAVRNYRFTFLRLVKDCKGSNSINNLQKTKGTANAIPFIFWRRARGFFGVLPYAFASLRSLTTDFQTVHRTVFIGKADRPCSNPLLSYQQKNKGYSKCYTLYFLAESKGFEPSKPFWRFTRFPIVLLRPARTTLRVTCDIIYDCLKKIKCELQ